MIRSIFIGFLILSALTTKGAEAQIAVSANISAAALRELISAVSACAEKIAGPSSEFSRSESIRSETNRSEISSIINCNSFESVNSHILSFNNNSREAFIVNLPTDGNICLARGESIEAMASQCADKGSYCCKSGLSPPN